MNTVIVDRDLPAFRTETAVIKRSAFRSVSDAASLLATAREKAEAIVKSADGFREAERQKGYQQGLEEGRREAAIHHLETVEQTLAYLDASCDAVVATVMQCLRTLVNEYPPEERVLLLAGKAIETLKHQTHVTLRVHPEDFELVSQRIAEVPLSRLPLKVAISEGVPRGGCWLESPMGVVDATLETQLAALSSALRKTL